MKKLIIDTGVQEFDINGKILRFNPADINVFKRLMDARDKITGIEQSLVEKAQNIAEGNLGATVIHLMAEADAEMKKVLRDIFGSENDFEEIFAGVNLMAVATNGERVITNFLAAITPILEEGARKAARAQATADAGKVQGNRAERRAKK